MKKLIVKTMLAALLVFASGAFSQDKNSSSSVVFFSAPSVNESYYSQKFDQLVAFYADFVSKMHPNDFAVIVADSATYPILAESIPEKHLLQGAARDIWIRDHGLICTNRGAFKTNFRPNYMSAADAKWMEDGFYSYFNKLNVPYKKLNMKLDGGNLMCNGGNRAVITERVLNDNVALGEASIRNILKNKVGVTELAIIPEEAGDTTGHADGMVKWLGPNTIAVNQYDDTNFRQTVIDRITETFPGIKIVDLVWNPTTRYWKDFADSTGVYVNALTTPNAIYVPTYDLPTDAEAVATFEAHADRKVIPIRVSQDIAIMGGAARCLSMQLYGAPADAFLKNQGIEIGGGSGENPGGGNEGGGGNNGGGNEGGGEGEGNHGGGNGGPNAGGEGEGENTDPIVGWDSSFAGTYTGSVYDWWDEKVGTIKLSVRGNRSVSGRVTFTNRKRGNIRTKASKHGDFEKSFWINRKGGKAYIEAMFIDFADGDTILDGSLETRDDLYFFSLEK